MILFCMKASNLTAEQDDIFGNGEQLLAVTDLAYRPQTKFAKVMFTCLLVILFTGGGAGVCLSACWDPPRSRHPPPEAGTPPPEQAGTSPGREHAGRYGQRAGGMHPTGMQSCFIS